MTHVFPMTNPSACPLSVSQCVRPCRWSCKFMSSCQMCYTYKSLVMLGRTYSQNCCHPTQKVQLNILVKNGVHDVKRCVLYSVHATVSEDILNCNCVVAFNVCKCLGRWHFCWHTDWTWYQWVSTCWRTKYWYVCFSWLANSVYCICFDVSVL